MLAPGAGSVHAVGVFLVWDFLFVGRIRLVVKYSLKCVNILFLRLFRLWRGALLGRELAFVNFMFDSSPELIQLLILLFLKFKVNQRNELLMTLRFEDRGLPLLQRFFLLWLSQLKTCHP